jgi:hypothetical protein
MGSRDPGFDEDQFETQFDDQLRNEFAQRFPVGREAEEAYNTLSPRFTRARRLQQLKQGLVGLAAAVVVLAGVGFGSSLVGQQSDRGTVVAGEPEFETGDENVGTLAVTGTLGGDTTGDSTADGDPASSGQNDGSGTMIGQPVTAPEPSTAATTAPTTSSGSSTSTPQTTSPTATTGQGSTSTTVIRSECGSIVVSVSGSEVMLLDSQANSGYSEDVKSTGPELIEVSFEGGREHCELKARVVDGQLVIENED